MDNENQPNQQPNTTVTPTEPSTQVSPTPNPVQPTVYTGQPSPQQANPVVSQPSSVIEQPKKRKHPILRIFVGVFIVLAIIIILLVVVFSKANSYVKPAEAAGSTFLQDMISGNAQSAYQLTASAFRQTTPESTFASITQAVHKNVSGQPTVQTYTVNTSNVNGSSTTTVVVNYSATGSGGSGLVNLTLQKVNGQWEIVGAHFPNFAVQGYTVQ